MSKYDDATHNVLAKESFGGDALRCFRDSGHVLYAAVGRHRAARVYVSVFRPGRALECALRVGITAEALWAGRGASAAAHLTAAGFWLKQFQSWVEIKEDRPPEAAQFPFSNITAFDGAENTGEKKVVKATLTVGSNYCESLRAPAPTRVHTLALTLATGGCGGTLKR